MRFHRSRHGAALVVGLLAACARAPAPERPPDLVLVVLDTLRADFTSLERGPAATPFLEAFAAQGTRFEHAYSTSCWTLPAHASMFTGELPDTHGADQERARVRAELPLLAERLAAAGYQTAGFTQNPWVSTRTGLQRGFEHLAELWPGRGGERPLVDEVQRWLAMERDPARPLFLFVNLIKPHAPYTPARAFAARHFEDEAAWQDAQARYASGPRDLIDRAYGAGPALDEREWQQVRALYVAELEQTDDIARRLLAAVDAACVPAHTLALIVSDHGEHLGEDGHASHMFVLSEPLTRVLCLARGPGFAAGAADARLAQLQDVYPTLLGAAGVACDAPAACDLRRPAQDERVLLTRIAWPRTWIELFPEELRGSPRLAPFLREVWAAQDGRFKLIVEGDGEERLVDPGQEAVPLDAAAVDTGALARLRAAVAASRARGERLEAGVDATGGVEELEALRALGYVR